MPKGTGKGAASKMGRRYEDLTGGALADHYQLGDDTINSPPPSEPAVRLYSGSHFFSVNTALRSGEAPVEEARFVQKGLDAMFKKPGAALQQDARLYRGVGVDDPILTQLRAGTLRAGTVFEDKGFMSTSVSQAAAMRFSHTTDGRDVILRIRAKKGKRAVHIESVSNHPSERETLLPRGSKIRVKGVSQGTAMSTYGTERNMTFIDVDLM